MIDPDVAFDKLCQFETADEVANFLCQEGIKGQRRVSDNCPISNWMSVTTGTSFSTGINVLLTGAGGSTWLRQNTAALIEFVGLFDFGAYPELILNCEEDES